MTKNKFCPECGSEEVQMVAGGSVGKWMCGQCGFAGSVFPEKELLEGEEEFEAMKGEVGDGIEDELDVELGDEE